MARGIAAARLTSVGYPSARRLLLVAGLVALGVLVGVLVVRSADDVEVVATLLYAPILVAFLFLGVPGGLVAGALATTTYVVLRADAIDIVGAGEFAGLIASRGLAYVLFGVAGGWAASTLEVSLTELERRDEIDHATGLGNARLLRHAVDLEQARAARYRTVFSVCVVRFPATLLDGGSARRRRGLLRELGVEASAGVRTVDRIAHHFDGRVHHLAAVLPETGGHGAAVFHERFTARILALLRSAGADDAQLSGGVCTLPGDEEGLDAMLAAWPGPAPVAEAGPGMAAGPGMEPGPP